MRALQWTLAPALRRCLCLGQRRSVPYSLRFLRCVRARCVLLLASCSPADPFCRTRLRLTAAGDVGVHPRRGCRRTARKPAAAPAALEAPAAPVHAPPLAAAQEPVAPSDDDSDCMIMGEGAAQPVALRTSIDSASFPPPPLAPWPAASSGVEWRRAALHLCKPSCLVSGALSCSPHA